MFNQKIMFEPESYYCIEQIRKENNVNRWTCKIISSA